jgi:aminoglycoside phosphotransferase family enzyme
MMKPSIIEDLKNPVLLPDRTEHVDVVQTHISIVFVADHFVYKVKKPVNFGFLDFSSLEKRRHYCRREVELNRRLAKDIYLGVLPITFDGEKHTMTGGAGAPVEYAVKMRRIPAEKLMKSMFQRGELTGDHLKNITEIIANFHSNALKTIKIDKFGEPEAFRVNTDENFAQVEKYIGVTISPKYFDAIKKWTASFYKTNGREFEERIKAGRIRDCHGDLHMEHVCLAESISIIDCIEFNDRFRYSDTVADIAFLLMDLEYHGGGGFAKIIWKHYKEYANEGNVDSLLAFYKTYRAFVRGKVNSFQLDDASITSRKKEQALQSAAKYFQLAYSYL